MDPWASNYNPEANTEDFSCIEVVYGCTDPQAANYDELANTDNGTCEEFTYGCTDNTALNYNPLANTLDNSCCYIGGCTDSTALNYNDFANTFAQQIIKIAPRTEPLETRIEDPKKVTHEYQYGNYTTTEIKKIDTSNNVG